MSFALSTLRDRVLSSIGLGTGFADTIKQFRLNINSVNKKESIMLRYQNFQPITTP